MDGVLASFSGRESDMPCGTSSTAGRGAGQAPCGWGKRLQGPKLHPLTAVSPANPLTCSMLSCY